MITERIKEAGDNLKTLTGIDRIQYLVDRAKDVEALPEIVKTEENRIHGCASKLWIIGGKREDNNMMYQVDGESHITRGTAKVVTEIVNGQPVEEVANLTVDSFVTLGIRELLTMQRQNGLGELINRIIRIANANLHV